jgi:hypothetical protein
MVDVKAIADIAANDFMEARLQPSTTVCDPRNQMLCDTKET